MALLVVTHLMPHHRAEVDQGVLRAVWGLRVLCLLGPKVALVGRMVGLWVHRVMAVKFVHRHPSSQVFLVAAQSASYGPATLAPSPQHAQVIYK